MKNQIKSLLVLIVVLFFFIPFNKTLATSAADNPCSATFPAQEYSLYTSSSPAQQQQIESDIQNDIQTLNGYNDSYNSTLSTDIQNITSSYAPTISLYQSEENQEVAARQDLVARSSGGNGYGSDGTSDAITQKYDTLIQGVTQQENDAIDGMKQTVAGFISTDNSCIDSLNTLTAQLNAVVNAPAVVTAPAPSATASVPTEPSVQIPVKATISSSVEETAQQNHPVSATKSTPVIPKTTTAVSTPVNDNIFAKIEHFFSRLF